MRLWFEIVVEIVVEIDCGDCVVDVMILMSIVMSIVIYLILPLREMRFSTALRERSPRFQSFDTYPV